MLETMNPTQLSDAELLKRWAEQDCTVKGSCVEQDVIADEIERPQPRHLILFEWEPCRLNNRRAAVRPYRPRNRSRNPHTPRPMPTKQQHAKGLSRHFRPPAPGETEPAFGGITPLVPASYSQRSP